MGERKPPEHGVIDLMAALKASLEASKPTDAVPPVKEVRPRTKRDWAAVNRLRVDPYGTVRGRRYSVSREGAKRPLRVFRYGESGKGEALLFAIETAGPGGVVCVYDTAGQIDARLRLPPAPQEPPAAAKGAGHGGVEVAEYTRRLMSEHPEAQGALSKLLTALESGEVYDGSAEPLAAWRSPAEAMPSEQIWIPFFGADMVHEEMPHFGHYVDEEDGGWWCDLCARWVQDVTLWYDLPAPGAFREPLSPQELAAKIDETPWPELTGDEDASAFVDRLERERAEQAEELARRISGLLEGCFDPDARSRVLRILAAPLPGDGWTATRRALLDGAVRIAREVALAHGTLPVPIHQLGESPEVAVLRATEERLTQALSQLVDSVCRRHEEVSHDWIYCHQAQPANPGEYEAAKVISAWEFSPRYARTSKWDGERWDAEHVYAWRNLARISPLPSFTPEALEYLGREGKA